MKKQAFLNEDDFFKSNQLDEGGVNLIKAIPTIQKKMKKIVKEQKEMPKEFIKFKKQVQDAFALIDGIVKEMSQKCKIERIANMIKNYSEFKNDFQWKLNDLIMNPRAMEEDNMMKEDESEYNKNRINITQ